MHFGAQKELFMRKVGAVSTLWRTEGAFHAKSWGGEYTLAHRRGFSCEKLRRWKHFGAQKGLFVRKVAAVETLWRMEGAFQAKSCGGCANEKPGQKKGRSLTGPLCLAAYN